VTEVIMSDKTISGRKGKRKLSSNRVYLNRKLETTSDLLEARRLPPFKACLPLL